MSVVYPGAIRLWLVTRQGRVLQAMTTKIFPSAFWTPRVTKIYFECQGRVETLFFHFFHASGKNVTALTRLLLTSRNEQIRIPDKTGWSELATFVHFVKGGGLTYPRVKGAQIRKKGEILRNIINVLTIFLNNE